MRRTKRWRPAETPAHQLCAASDRQRLTSLLGAGGVPAVSTLFRAAESRTATVRIEYSGSRADVPADGDGCGSGVGAGSAIRGRAPLRQLLRALPWSRCG